MDLGTVVTQLRSVDLKTVALVASPVLVFVGAIAGAYVGARWKGEADVRVWHRQQLLQAVVSLLQAADRAHTIARRLEIPYRRETQARRLSDEFDAALVDISHAGTLVEVLAGPELVLAAADLFGYWLSGKPADELRLEGKWKDPEHERALFGAVLLAAREELEMRPADPYGDIEKRTAKGTHPAKATPDAGLASPPDIST